MGIVPHTRRRFTTQAIEGDANEAFVRARCRRWMVRIMDRHPLWDHETFVFLLWLVGARSDLLTALVLTALPEDRQERLQSDLIDAADVEEQARALARELARWPAHSLRALVKPLVQILESDTAGEAASRRSDLAHNLVEFRDLFGLSDLEAEVCLFLGLMSAWTPVERYFDSHLDCDRYTGRKYLLTALELSGGQFESMIHGRLRRLGFVDMDRAWLELTRECLPLITESANAVLTRDHYRPLPAPTVALDEHVVRPGELEHLRSLLAEKRDSATHVLFYGTPGTGKTSFASALAAELDCPAYEILHHAENKVQARRLGLVSCLNLTNHGKGSLVVVDEADNLLNTDDGWLARGESQDKGWLNGLLEEPGARVIWITNRVENIDPSVRRRFSYSLHFPPFGRRQREQLWTSILRQHRVKRFFTAADIAELSREYPVSAGAIALAVRKSREAEFDGKGDLLAKIRRSLDAHLTLLRDGAPDSRSSRIEAEGNYVLEALNLDCDPREVLDRARRFDEWWRRPAGDRPVRSLNLLFHGPSGTGKTELARHLATELDRPLVVKRASDLLGSYVGQTEQALAAAFGQAERDEAMLLIDEADSLLFPRGRAQRSWEVSFTNEFLTQMERFRGLLICTTNRVCDLDDASLRRFSRKVEFRPLTGNGALMLYRRLLDPLVGGHPTPQQQEDLERIAGLTPGIFRLVRDEAVLSGRTPTHGDLITALRREIGLLKEIRGRRIGFGS